MWDASLSPRPTSNRSSLRVDELYNGGEIPRGYVVAGSGSIRDKPYQYILIFFRVI
jgi:hypothetical protein